MTRFQELSIEAEHLGDRNVYISSWRENNIWRAIITEQGRIAASVREFTGQTRDEAIDAARADGLA